MNGANASKDIKVLKDRVAKLDAQMKVIMSVIKDRGGKIESLEKDLANTKIANDLV